ncbi:FecR domain-containing protein [Botrimarina colliarenosi]|nr:FecR family protein [Botrimarina colliarenosi]
MSPSAVAESVTAQPDDSSPTDEKKNVEPPHRVAPATALPQGFRLWSTGAAFIATAACLLATLWFWSPDRLGPTRAAPARTGNFAIGRVLPGADLRLASATSALLGADQLVSGLLEIETGSLSIEFASGVEMDLTGPAQCEVVSGMLVRLRNGQATAQVPRWARGFTIETPDVGVVDLGTRFGVAREIDGKTDVVVFEGEVDLKSLQSEERSFERRLTQGEAARVDRLGGMERIFQVHGEWTGNGWSTARRPENDALIAAVWDNLGASKSVSYYQVLAGGFGEDAPSYVDHPHEWNGLDHDGLPDFLAGADYVRTVNDYRYRGELTIQIEFAQDAELYVFFDNRVAIPDWLLADYEDTGVDIGLDEDAWFGNPEFSVASGPGESIDNVFSVWKRPFRRGQVVTLGSMGVGREARAMYGIAATPR